MSEKLSLVLWVYVFLFGFNAMAQDATSGYCGPKDGDGNYGTNCEWNYDAESKTLRILGSGAMYSSTGDNSFPWSKGQVSFYGDIENVVIEDGITNLGSHSFYGLSGLKNITLPNTLTQIGWNVFNGTTQLASIIIPDSLTYIGGSANYRSFSSGLTMLYCSEKQRKICTDALEWSRLDANQVLQIYQKMGKEYYYFDGKFYRSPKDIGTKDHIQKRIYTIEEANMVAGDKNRVSIRYK